MAALPLPSERPGRVPSFDPLLAELDRVTRWVEALDDVGEVEGAREELVRAAERASELLYVLSARLGTGGDERVLVLSLLDRRVQVGDSKAIDLSRRRKPWLLLGRLVRERLAAPGRGVPVPSLVAAAWPDERILPQAAARRVYSVVQELRKLGLGGVVVGARVGYRIDPGVRILVVQHTSG